jgi:hypothetical protein
LTRLERLARDKRSSLFVLVVRNEKKVLKHFHLVFGFAVVGDRSNDDTT